MKRTSSGKRNVPMRICVYGEPGIGKTSWSANAPGAVILDLEAGSSHLDVDRIEVDGFQDILDVVRETKRGTLVIDSLSRVEEAITDHVLGQDKKTGVTLVNFGPGYGHGVNLAVQYMRELMSAIDRCPANVILVAHSQVKAVNDPTGLSFDRYQLAMNDKLANVVLKNCDYVLFARFSHETRKSDRKSIGVTGERVLQTDANAAWLAKHRGSLPESIPLDWQTFQDAVEADRDNAEADRARVNGLMVEACDNDGEKYSTMKAALDAAGTDTIKLAALERRVTQIINENKKETAS